MTLFIACLLIYNFHMEWWWYGIAGVLWLIHAYQHRGDMEEPPNYSERLEHIRSELADIKRSLRVPN